MPIKNTQQLKARIKNQAREKNSSPQWLLTSFMMERFLDRLSHSRYKDNFVLKGGTLIALLLDSGRRSSFDLDLCLLDLSLDQESIKEILEQILSISLNDRIRFDLDDLSFLPISPERICYRAKVTARFEKIRVSFSLDLTSKDVITPKAVHFAFKPLFDPGRIEILAYPIESILSEKTQAILSSNIHGTRIRDFYDIYVLTHMGPGYVPKILLQAILHTFKSRDSLSLLEHLPDLLEEIEKAQSLQRLWKSYQKKYAYARNITFEDCCRALREMLEEVLPGKFAR